MNDFFYFLNSIRGRDEVQKEQSSSHNAAVDLCLRMGFTIFAMSGIIYLLFLVARVYLNFLLKLNCMNGWFEQSCKAFVDVSITSIDAKVMAESFILTLAYLLFLYVLKPPLKKAAIFLTDLEFHKTKEDYNFFVMVKSFFLQYASQSIAMIYAVVALRDLKVLRFLLVSTLVFNFLKSKVDTIVQQKLVHNVGTTSVEITIPDETSIDNSSENRHEDTAKLRKFSPMRSTDEWKEKIEGELRMSKCDPDEDYCHMLLQYGLIVTFSVAFPIVPLILLRNSIDEVSFLSSQHCHIFFHG